MKIDAQLGPTDLHDVAQAVQRYERLGFDGVWTLENMHDPYVPLVLAAQATQRLQLGTNIAIAFARSPFSTAVTAWDMQHLSRGRFHLGLGTQVRAHVERRFSMPFEHPARRIKDYVRCLRAVWDSFQTGAPANYEGEFFRFKLITPAFNPGPLPDPHVPVFLAGFNPVMCKAAGEVADGFHAHPFVSRAYLQDVILANVDAGARTRGKRVQDMTISAPIFTASGETQQELDAQIETIRRKISFYASTPNYHAVLRHHGMEALGLELSKLVRQGAWDAMARMIPDALLDLIVVVAPPAQLGARLRERYQGLVDRISLYYQVDPADPDARWTQFVAAFRAA